MRSHSFKLAFSAMLMALVTGFSGLSVVGGTWSLQWTSGRSKCTIKIEHSHTISLCILYNAHLLVVEVVIRRQLPEVLE